MSTKRKRKVTAFALGGLRALDFHGAAFKAARSGNVATGSRRDMDAIGGDWQRVVSEINKAAKRLHSKHAKRSLVP